MAALMLILLCGMAEWNRCQAVYPKEIPRVTRHGTEDWRPVVEKYTSVLRYPMREIYPKGQYGGLAKKKTQIAEHSEKVEVFAGGPPSILGSFSVFGHASLNAREHASQLTNKAPRPAPLNYQMRQPEPQKPQPLPQRYPTFDDHNYFLDGSFRPPHLGNPTDNLLAHSASLVPNTYYFEPAHAFRAPEYHKLRKPAPIQNPFRHGDPLLYQSPTVVERYKLSTQAPPHLETAVDYYDTKNRKLAPSIPNIVRGTYVHFDRNPFGEIRYGTRRPETGPKPVTDDRTPAKDVFRQLSHLGRPFQSSPPFSPTSILQTEKDFRNFEPYVTTYSSTSAGKLSGQPFRAPSNYDNNPIVSSVKPDFFVTQQPYTRDSFSVTATTLVDSPTEQSRGTEPTFKETYTENTYVPEIGQTHLPSLVKETDSGFKPSFQLPQVRITSQKGHIIDSSSPFLPTPSTDTEAYLNEPMRTEDPTPNPILFNEISKKPKPSSGPEHEKPTEYFTEPVTTTTEVVEINSRRRGQSKIRRRPVRPTEASLRTTEDAEDNLKNHKVTNDGLSSTTDYQKNQRRRKPNTPYNTRGGGYGTKNRYPELKRQRISTTTTTPEPEVYEATQYSVNEYTTVPDLEEPNTTFQFTSSEIKSSDSKEDYYGSTELAHYSEKFPNEVQTYETEAFNNYFEETPITVPTTTPPLTTLFTTTTSTTPTPTTESTTTTAGSRFRNKYGSATRPRFSVKDYRERLNRMTTTSSPQTEHTDISKTEPKEQGESARFSTRIRGSNQQKNGSEGNEQKQRKYKPRIGASRYKTSTPRPSTEPTTEKSSTVRTSSNRYKPGTGKYYSRYRTSTVPSKETEPISTTTARSPVRPKGVFSAKRRPFPLKTKTDRTDNETRNAEESQQNLYRLTRPPSSFQTHENELFPGITKKMDNTPTTTVSAEDLMFDFDSEQDEDPTGAEAMRIADLTSSSSNEFHSSGFLKGVSPSSRRTIPKITISTDDPILPLEAFFQTQNNKDKK